MTVHVRRGLDGLINLISASPYEDENGPTTETLADDDAEVVAFRSPETEPDGPIPSIYAIAHMVIDDGAVTSITPSARIGGAFYIDTGVYWVFFASPQPDTAYIPLCYNHSHEVTVSETYEDFFVVTAELDGVPSDPPSFSVEIKRVN